LHRGTHRRNQHFPLQFALNLNDRELRFRRSGAIERTDDIMSSATTVPIKPLGMVLSVQRSDSTSSDVDWPAFQGPSSELATTQNISSAPPSAGKSGDPSASNIPSSYALGLGRRSRIRLVL